MTFKKYPDIERLGQEDNKDIFLSNEDTLVVEEKVDGGNGSMWLEEDGIHFGSRNRDLTTDNDKKTFAGFQVQLRTHLESVKLNADYIYYFEWMAKHTISYTAAPFVIGIDIRLKHAANQEGYGFFLGRDAKEQEFKRIGIECVPCVWRGTVKEIREKNIMDLIPRSKYYDGMAEGIVIKNYCRKHPYDNHQLYAKVVRDEFKEDNKAVFGSMRGQISDTHKVIEEFCTDARIRKAVLKFVNEDNLYLDLKLMAKVPSYVILDILKEEIKDIYWKYKFLDFKEMRQKVPKKCLPVITQMMEEKAK